MDEVTLYRRIPTVHMSHEHGTWLILVTTLTLDWLISKYNADGVGELSSGPGHTHGRNITTTTYNLFLSTSARRPHQPTVQQLLPRNMTEDDTK